MSYFTDYGENKFADFIRGLGFGTLPGNWYAAPLSAGSDSSFTEITTGGLARAAIPASLSGFLSTQGNTSPSTGTTHQCVNAATVNMGTATGAVGTVSHVGLFTASTGGSCWAIVPLDTPIVTANGVDVTIPAGDLKLTLGLFGGCSDYLVNKLLDAWLRGQSFTMPANGYVAAMLAPSSNAGGGTEVSLYNYARVAVPFNTANWSGTQAAGTTGASTGTGGRISNNLQWTWPTPTGPQGVVNGLTIYDSSSGGNPLFYGSMVGKTIDIGAGLFVAADKFGITVA